MADVHIRRGQEEYRRALANLLPRGIAWPRLFDPNPDPQDPERKTTVLMRVVHGLAGILGFIDNRAADMLEIESDPRTTVELLPDWERNWGLPDPCYAEPVGIADRQRALVQRMTLMGGQSRQFFYDVAAFLGYTITISEYRPFMVGVDRCGDNREVIPLSVFYTYTPLYIEGRNYFIPGSLGPWPNNGIGDPVMRFYWTVHVKRMKLTWFRVTKGQTGIDPHLRIGLATDLECVLRRWRPAQTALIFDYSGVTPPDSMAGTP